MKTLEIVTPSSQIDTTLPLWIRSPDVVVEGSQYNSYSQENHRNFVDFMTRSGESQERLGFSENLLQNLLSYKDFNTYRNPIIAYGILTTHGEVNETDIILGSLQTGQGQDLLAARPLGQAALIDSGITIEEEELVVDAEEVDQLELIDGYGFPEENGVILIDDEVILYRRREGNILYDLRRGSSGTSILPTFRHDGVYRHKTEPAKHYSGSVVYNLSVLFLTSILDQIHKTYAHKIDSTRVVPEVNRDTLLKNIKDFFKSKGSKLGIKALFKILFNENDVDVHYPGDRMIKPSESTWTKGLLLRTVPIPKILCDPEEDWTTPDNTIGSTVELKSYSTVTINKEGEEYSPTEDDVFAKTYSDYTVSYQYGDETQYEIYLSKEDLEGEFIANPNTRLTRQLYLSGFGDSNDERRDTTTVTVESTLGFPNRGVIFIDEEAIFYTDKTPNQFLNCQRGYIGVNARHKKGANVYGPYYVETRITDKEGKEFVSRSWPLGLVESVSVEDPGLLHQLDTPIHLNGPGLVDFREPILATLTPGDVHFTFLENYDDRLTTQQSADPEEIAYVGDRTYGPDGVYYDEKYVFVSSSGFPSYKIGYFTSDLSIPVEDKVGPLLVSDQVISVIPRRETIKDNIISEGKYIFESKGTDKIGVFVDGVRAYSNKSPKTVTQGRIVKYNIINKGYGYKNPTLVVTPSATGDIELSPVNGEVISVTPGSDDNFDFTPRARISSGERAVIELDFDQFGRITRTYLVRGGQYYNDIPSLKVVDATGVGKGGLLSCDVENGSISQVTILNAGIDYNKLQTRVEVIPVGSGAEIEAIVESYDINRYTEITYSNNYQFDAGNGFLFEPPVGTVKKFYGYVCDPIKVREELEDDGTQHSPILGWAFDGNPIYGPYGYGNNKDLSGGIERQQSAYHILQSRLSVVPDGGKLPGLNPPSLADYQMGSFVQDFTYDPDYYKISGSIVDPIDGYLAGEDDLFLHTDKDKFIEIIKDNNPGIGQIYPNNLLDENNGKICNTPDFPVELYPDGVYCYFITIDEAGQPAFPYIIGKTFNNRPISQAINIISQESIDTLPKSLIYKPNELDGVTITFDFEKVERLRNPYLEPTSDGVKLEMGEILEGTIEDIIIEIPKPTNTAIGDRVFFDNKGTTGAGAQGVVSEVKGKGVVNAGGSEITTTINSHHQRLDLRGNLDDKGDPIYFTIVEDNELDLFGSDNTTVHINTYYDFDQGERPGTGFSSQNIADVTTTTELIPQPGDQGFDNKKKLFDIQNVQTLSEVVNQSSLWFESVDHLETGDVVRIKNGSLYDDYIPHEEVKIQKIGGKKLEVVRGFRNDPKPIEDGTEVVHTTKFLYKITTDTPHLLKKGDYITIRDSLYISGTYPVAAVTDTEIHIHVDELYGVDDPDVYYSTQNPNAQGEPLEITTTSPGFGYNDLPKCLGLYKRFIDRGEFKITKNGTQIAGVEVLNGGARYVNPTAVIVDFENRGSGAEADVVVVDGRVKYIYVTKPGADYIDPVIYLVEMDGKYICTTNNIGKIKSVKVINPGRNISADRSLKPEIKIDTRHVIDYYMYDSLVIDGGTAFIEHEDIADGGSRALPENPVLDVADLIDMETVIVPFVPGEIIYQGTEYKYLAVGEVIDYDFDRQILTLNKVEGVFKEDEMIYNTTGTRGNLVVEGQADCRCVVNGSSTPAGRFIDDTSMVSRRYAVIQDSYRYQWFSYVISSPIQQVDFGEFVREIIHPAGFIQFTDLTLHDSIQYVNRTKYYKNSVTSSIDTLQRAMVEETTTEEDVIRRVIRTRMVAVGEGDVVRMFIDPCAPLVLLDAQGIPIIAGTDAGNRFILTNSTQCVDGEPLTLNT